MKLALTSCRKWGIFAFLLVGITSCNRSTDTTNSEAVAHNKAGQSNLNFLSQKLSEIRNENRMLKAKHGQTAKLKGEISELEIEVKRKNEELTILQERNKDLENEIIKYAP